MTHGFLDPFAFPELRYGTRNQFLQRPNSPDITVWKSLKSPVKIVEPKK